MDGMKKMTHEDRVRLVRKSALELGEKSTALTDGDFDLAAAAMVAYRNSRLREEPGPVTADDTKESQFSLSSAQKLLEEEATSDIRKGIGIDLLLGVAPSLVLVSLMSLYAHLQNTVISFRAVSIVGALLVLSCIPAMGVALGYWTSQKKAIFGRWQIQSYLATSVGSLVAGVFLFVCAGGLLSMYTKNQQADAVEGMARELRLFDSAVALSAVAEQRGLDRVAALSMAAEKAGVHFDVQSKPPKNVRMVATAGLTEGPGAVTLTYESALIEALRPFARVEARNERVSASHEYIIGRIHGEQRGTDTISLSSVDNSAQVMSYSIGSGLSVPPPKTIVIATLKGGKVVGIDPIDWLATRLPESKSSSEESPRSPRPKN
jgi:hypothetical protein